MVTFMIKHFKLINTLNFASVVRRFCGGSASVVRRCVGYFASVLRRYLRRCVGSASVFALVKNTGAGEPEQGVKR